MTPLASTIMKARAVMACCFAAALLASAGGAGAQMVVDRNVGEQVDYPYFTGHGTDAIRHRRHAAPPRFTIVQTPLPTPRPFGWLTCCL